MSKVTHLKWDVLVGVDPTVGLTTGDLVSEWVHHPDGFVGYDLVWTDTTEGEIVVELSNDGSTVIKSMAYNDADWKLQLTNPAGSAGTGKCELYTTASYSRVKYNVTAGTGQLTGTVTSKPLALGIVDIPVPLNLGGTEATTAAGARTSLHVGQQTINPQTDTTYTPVTADANNIVTLSNAAAITVTLPTPTSISVNAGETVTFVKEGAGDVTYAAGAGVTINSPESCLRQITQFSMVFATAKSTTLWNLSGALVA